MNLLQNKSILWLAFGMLVLFVLSYFREGFFLSLNGVILNNPSSNAYFDSILPYFKQLDLKLLVQLKWIGTILFSLSFMIFTLFFLQKVFNSKKPTLFIAGLYFLFISLSLIVGVFGYFFFSFDKVYGIIREIFGFIQSPLPYFLAVPLFYFLKISKN